MRFAGSRSFALAVGFEFIVSGGSFDEGFGKGDVQGLVAQELDALDGFSYTGGKR